MVAVKSQGKQAEQEAEMNAELFGLIEFIANERHGGHFTIMKFTTNWRISFGTPNEREDIEEMPVGDTFLSAAKAAIIKEIPIKK